MLPELRRYWLADRAAQWSYIVSMVSDSSRFGEEDVLKEIESHLYGAHMCVLALSHLRGCINHLRSLRIDFPPDLRTAIRAFTDEYESAHIEDARHALEHEEDRVYGEKSHTKKPYEGDFPNPRVTGRKTGSPRLTMIQVLDDDFDLSGVIQAAIVLNSPLRGLAEELFGR